MIRKSLKASIIIPSRNATAHLTQAVVSILKLPSCQEAEIIIVNDGLDEATANLGSHQNITVVDGDGRGPAAARNIGVQNSRGRILVFLDDDCRVSPDWLTSHLHAHERYGGLLVVGGSICFDPDAPLWGRCDHYCSWYHVSPGRSPAWVQNHPAANLSVSRSTFEHVGPFREDLPRAGVHEETEWQGRLHRLGGRIRFEPRARVWHTDRDDLRGYLQHNYRWGYNSIAVKSSAPVSRFPWVYRRPWVLIGGVLPFAVAYTLYTLGCWLKVGKVEPLLLSPFLFLGRIAYASGMAIGGFRAIRKKKRAFGDTKWPLSSLT